MVTDYVRTRTQEEVLDMVKHGLKSRRGQQAKAEQFSIAKKRQGNTAIKSDPTGRMESFTDVDVNISGASVCVCALLALQSCPLFLHWLQMVSELCRSLVSGHCV